MSKAKKIFEKIKEKLSDMFHDFFDWFQENVKPELLDFLDDNRDLAMKIIIAVAKDFAGKPSHLKFDSAYDALVDEFKDNAGSLTVDNQWIRLLIELVVAAAKASGKI